MGSSYSYLKIKVLDCTMGIIINNNDNTYIKILLAVGHPINSHKTISDSNYTEYNNYGDWYYYDGDINKLKNILSNFNPKNDNIKFLVSRLTTECNLDKYYRIWDKIMAWVSNIGEILKNQSITLLILSGGQKLLEYIYT